MRTWKRRLGEDRGSTPIKYAILLPIVGLFFFTIVQVGLVYHAKRVATAAAQQGVTAARAYDAAPDSGDKRAQRFMDQIPGRFLTDRQTATRNDGDLVSVSVTATPFSILPGKWFRFTTTVTAAKEVFTTS